MTRVLLPTTRTQRLQPPQNRERDSEITMAEANVDDVKELLSSFLEGKNYESHEHLLKNDLEGMTDVDDARKKIEVYKKKCVPILERDLPFA